MAVRAVAQNEPQTTAPSSAQPMAYDDYYAASQDGAGSCAGRRRSGENRCRDSRGRRLRQGDEEKPTCRWCMCGKLGDPWTLPQPELPERP